ncbi:hypothetical protein OJF2_67500 [Aquisphaera giovannonii]|uniref:Uncharacterized protein n=1 Tax=Aquisphaera giovannonii TaxID=406548 RepID=A0A5B9WC43_9BACT|nr:hypothetical protein [Aquisphaera giovannonii]QEH38152.1 hypothetical protein OJF2_67500 [Aquisphaera giovannonii]
MRQPRWFLTIQAFMLGTVVLALLMGGWVTSAMQAVALLVVWQLRRRTRVRSGPLLLCISPPEQRRRNRIVLVLALAFSLVLTVALGSGQLDDMVGYLMIMSIYSWLILGWAEPEFTERGLLRGRRFHPWAQIRAWWWGVDGRTLQIKLPFEIYAVRVAIADRVPIQSILEANLGAAKELKPDFAIEGRDGGG